MCHKVWYHDMDLFAHICDPHYMPFQYTNIIFFAFVFIFTQMCLSIQIWGNGWYKIWGLGILD